MLSLYDNILTIGIVVTLALSIAFFPEDEFSQWAARKPFLRNFFDLKDVRIGAQTKFVKSDKLVWVIK